jgi:hypothetical protein
MSDEPFPDHLGQIAERVNELKGQIPLAMQNMVTQPAAAYASLHELDQTISDLERQHSNWSRVYFLFRITSGPGSETVQQYQQLSDKISRNLARMHIWVLMGAGESARFLGRWDEAQQSAADGVELCGTRADLVAERTQFLLQLAGISYEKNELAAARGTALSAYYAALSGGLWLNAAHALIIGALCALLLDDRQSFTRCCADAAQLAAAHGGDPQMRQLGETLRGFQVSAQSTLDKTGRSEAERKQLAESTLRSVLDQIKQQAQ